MENFKQKNIDFEWKVWFYLDSGVDWEVYFCENQVLKIYSDLSIQDLQIYYQFSKEFEKYMKQNYNLDLQVLLPNQIWEYESGSYAILPLARWINFANYKSDEILKQTKWIWKNQAFEIIQMALKDFSWINNIYLSENNIKLFPSWKIIITDTGDNIKFLLSKIKN